jgi:uncharacterized protein (TIGR00162 family)
MSEEFIIKKIGQKPILKKPILIEGLPGVGNVARIVVDFLISKLKAKKFLEVYSYYFPNSVFLEENHKLEMPKIEFFYHKNKKGNDLVFIIGDVQPADEYASYAFSQKIIEIADTFKVKEVITLGGITSRSDSEKPDVFGAYTDVDYVKKLKKIGVRFDRKGSIIVIGAAGLLLGLGKLKEMKGFSLLAETTIEQNKLGINAAKQIINVLVKYFGFKFSSKEIDEMKDFKRMRLPMVKTKLKQVAQPSGPLTYIG